MVNRLGVQGLDDTDVIRDGLNVREEVADPGAMLAAGFAFLERGPDRVVFLSGSHPREALGAFDRRREVFARKLVQGGLVVEQVDVGQAAGLEEAEDPFGLWGEVRKARQAAFAGLRASGQELGEEHRAESEAADPAGGLPDESAAGEMILKLVLRIHGFSCGSRFR